MNNKKHQNRKYLLLKLLSPLTQKKQCRFILIFAL